MSKPFVRFVYRIIFSIVLAIILCITSVINVIGNNRLILISITLLFAIGFWVNYWLTKKEKENRLLSFWLIFLFLGFGLALIIKDFNI